MYYLNTTRHLATPANDRTVARLLDALEDQILPRAASLEGIRDIEWRLSLDRRVLQAYSGWAAETDLTRAERSAQHRENGELINELLGGLSRPQSHGHYRTVARWEIG